MSLCNNCKHRIKYDWCNIFEEKITRESVPLECEFSNCNKRAKHRSELYKEIEELKIKRMKKFARMKKFSKNK